MTGPGPGKIKLIAKVIYLDLATRRELDVDVYLHVKGWSRAPVTHIDIEGKGIEYMLVGGPDKGVYGEVKGTGQGIHFSPYKRTWRLEIIEHTILARAIPGGEKFIAYMGGKKGGVFLGIQKPIPSILEKLAEDLYGIKPRKRPRRV